jgi:hypothetical protein
VGYVADSADCDDTDPDINPGRVESCNGVDDDCSGTPDDNVPGAPEWYEDADGDSYGNAAAPLNACDQPAGYVANATDCNDADSTAYPGAPEACDGADQDCDLVIDNDICACAADPECDGVTNVIDVVHTVNIAFRGESDIADPAPLCPFTTTDVDCNSITNVVDVVKFVNVAFRGETAAANFCDPCPGS